MLNDTTMAQKLLEAGYDTHAIGKVFSLAFAHDFNVSSGIWAFINGHTHRHSEDSTLSSAFIPVAKSV